MAPEPKCSDCELYPFRTVSALTGVTAVTLRAWERLYGLVQPRRTPKGRRLYGRADIERIRRVLQLLERGISISQARRVLEAEEAAAGDPAGRVPAIPFGIEDLPEIQAQVPLVIDLDRLVRQPAADRVARLAPRAGLALRRTVRLASGDVAHVMGTS